MRSPRAEAGRRAPTPARACALAVVRRVFEHGAWADRVLHAEAQRRGLDARERALAMRLAYGTVQRRATLDHLIEALSGRATDKLEPAVLGALRLGLYQLAFLDRVPAHAAVDESVELAKLAAPRGAGLVNAVLRRGAREAAGGSPRFPTPRPPRPRSSTPIPSGSPRCGGRRSARTPRARCMAAGNVPAEAALRANTLVTTAAELARGCRSPAVPRPACPRGSSSTAPSTPSRPALGPGPLHAAVARRDDRRRLLSPRPGERVLDLCAAPGAKTTHLAALMGGRGAVVAVERHPGRADALRRTAARMGAGSAVEVRTADAAAAADPAAYDRVLVDPPCTDLGTLASRPDARWRKAADLPRRLAREQAAILRAGADALRPGGTLVYSTCTISPAENEALVQGFLAGRPDFAADDLRPDVPLWEHARVPEFAQSLPHRDGTEGFFVARLRRSAG